MKQMTYLMYLVALCGVTVLGLTIDESPVNDPDHIANEQSSEPLPDETGTDYPDRTWDASDGHPDIEYIETPINTPGSDFSISRVDILGQRRVKRGVQNITNQWGYEIPYRIDSTYAELGVRSVKTLKRVFRKISDYVCVVFVDVTLTYNESDPNWLTNNGFKFNSFLHIKRSRRCAASFGYGRGGRNIYPCNSFESGTHEVFHTLGGLHTIKNPAAKKYLSLWKDNIKPRYLVQYATNANFFGVVFDALSLMTYKQENFNLNGLECWVPIREDVFVAEASHTKDLAAFFEFNIILKCSERFCGGAKPDCGQGQYIRYKGVCQCVCPADFDPATNCTKVFNGPNTRLTWPQVPFALVGGGASTQCPTGFNPGYFTFDGSKPTQQKPAEPLVLPTSGDTLHYPVCTRDVPQNSSYDWESWETFGHYCILKGSDECGGAFTEYWINFQSYKSIKYNGSLGATVIDGNSTTMKCCCRNTEGSKFFVELPNDVPFRLFAIRQCPQVRGMREYRQVISHFTAYKAMNGSLAPKHHSFTEELQMFHCIYMPLTYGCSQDITLNDQTRSVTVTTPGYGVGRSPLTRCIFTFSVPAFSKIRISFNKCDLDHDDKLMVKKYHKFQEPLRITCKSSNFQIISEGEFLLMDYQSSYPKVSNWGLNFTADVLLPEDHCYNATTYGDDYFLESNVAETYEACIPWAQTVNCSSYPTTGMTNIWTLLSDNSCRNPSGELLQPWCFVYVNGSNCWPRYCDVNNFLAPIDSSEMCPTLVKQDPTFCGDSLQRNMCFKSCNFQQPSTKRATCGQPTIPSDGTQVSPRKSSYKQGERVLVNCTSIPSTSQSEMLCTKDGWTTLTTACPATACVDALSAETCRKLMMLLPSFCSHPKFKSRATFHCKKSCGACTANSSCTAPNSATYSSVPGNSEVKAGQVMYFECKPNLYHVSGDLQRACSQDGTLVGSEPMCQEQPAPQDVNINAIRSRKKTISKNLAFILPIYNLVVPNAGVVDRLYYYCSGHGSVTFFFVRPTGSSSEYKFVGSVNITCTYINWRWTFNIPPSQQILVQKGDILGIFSISRAISSTGCNKVQEEITRSPTMAAKTFSEVLRSLTFTDSTCIIPSVGYRVSPVHTESGPQIQEL